MITDRVSWFDINGVVVCGPCRREMLDEWSPAEVKRKGGTEDEVCRPGDFTALGRTPWAGSEAGGRYMQCDVCLGQWGPDAY